MSAWKSATNPPGHVNAVLVYFDDFDSYCVGWHNPTVKRWVGWGHDMRQQPSHWMELPDSPKEAR
jgi:hypothetical protein